MTAEFVDDKIRDHLRNSETRTRLRERFAAARNQLTTSIGEVAKLAGVPAEKARYAESIGILSPGRSNEMKDGAHRRYSLGELNRLILMGDLMAYGFSMGDIAHYLTHNRNATDLVVDSIQSSDLTTRLRNAETSYLQTMLIPRLMYFSQCLLLGDVLDCSIGLVLPVGSGAPEASPAAAITDVDELPLLGPSLVGWHSRSHPYCVLFMREPQVDDDTRYAFRSVDEMCREAGVFEVDEQPTGAYLLIEREFAHLLYAPSSNRSRTERPRFESIPLRSDQEPRHPSSRAVAHRLLRLLHQPSDESSPGMGHQYTSIGDGMIYSSPEFLSDMAGDRLLTEIAELVVRLGNAVKHDAASPRGRWIFSAILLPDDPSLPPGQQSLVVTAQSKQSPHVLGVTRLTPGKNEGLSTMAALSGHMLLRRAVESIDAAVADAGFEGEPGPALAVPIVNAHGKVLAVLYVRARYEKNTTTGDTFTADDQLLLRVIGHVIGGFISGFRGNHLTRDGLAGMIDQPRNVDRFLQEFSTANAFWADLESVFDFPLGADESRRTARTANEAKQAKWSTLGRESVNSIALLAIDIDGHTRYVNAYGSNTARYLIRSVGRRIAGQPLLSSSPLMGPIERNRNKLYHIYGDRFFLLLEDITKEVALSFARNLKELLTGSYTLDLSRSSSSQGVPASSVKIEDVSVRIAVIHYDSEALNRLLRPVTVDDSQTPEPLQGVISIITNALDAGLSQAKQIGPGAMVYLDTATSLFRRLPTVEESERSADQAAGGGPTAPSYANNGTR